MSERLRENPEPIRLCHFIDSLRRDGAQRALLHLVAGLSSKGYAQRVYCLNDVVDQDLLARLRETGADVRVVGKIGILTGIGLVRTFGDLRTFRPHIVQTFLPVSDNVGRCLAKAAGAPVIVSSIRTRNVDKRFWQLFLDRRTTRWADAVIFNCRSAVEFGLKYEGVRPEQVEYVPNGVNPIPPPEPRALAALRRELGLKARTAVVGTVGRLYPQKGHGDLLEAFASVRRRVPEAVLLVVGKGPLLGRLQSTAEDLGIADRVRFLGGRNDVPLLLGLMDVYVHASLFEGMSNAVMEAMAAGKPVVATAVDGTVELIEHDRSGKLVKPGDPRELAEALIETLLDSHAADRLGREAARRVETDFSIEKMVDSFDGIYRRLLERTGTDNEPS